MGGINAGASVGQIMERSKKRVLNSRTIGITLYCYL